MSSALRLSLLLCVLFALPGCAPLLTMAGSAGSAVELAAQIDKIKLVGDGVSYVRSKKTLTDHALSKVTGRDCRLTNIILAEQVCARGTAKPQVVDERLLEVLAEWDRAAEPYPTLDEGSEELPDTPAAAPLVASHP